ncbi:MAG: tetratricopeptide repeat protein, partial [Bacteroidia bacterium]|nr:tetratricopeptide repeat protein [Bacteroidia bacterium]
MQQFIIILLFIVIPSIGACQQSLTEKADAIYKLALTANQNAKYDSSIYYFKKASEQYRSIEDWENYINAEIGIGWVLATKGQYENSLEHLHITLDKSIRRLTEKHISTASCYNNIGIAYDYKGNY